VAPGELNALAEGATEGEATVDGQPKRKRARRGSRGGRKRRKPSANGDHGEADTAGEPEAIEPDAVGPNTDGGPVAVTDPAVEETAPAYVPMSEWIGDFDSRSQRS
jgi:hypothetical protein